MSAPPLVSIVLPTYNREAYLREAVESVLAQTYGDWELLILDDGSTDGTRDYLDTLADARVRSLVRPHCGNPALLRNLGVRGTRGPLIAFLDSDDTWLPDKLARQVEDLLAHPACAWGYTGVLLQNEPGRNAQWVGGRWIPYEGWILERVISVPGLIATPAVMIQRRLFETVEGFDDSLLACEDLDLWIRLAEASPATVVATPLVRVRQHAGNRPTRSLLPLICLNRIYGRLLVRTASARVRRVGRRQWIRVSLSFAGRLRREDAYAEAWQALRMSFRHAGWHPGWWIALLKTGLRRALVSAARPRDRGR